MKKLHLYAIVGVTSVLLLFIGSYFIYQQINYKSLKCNLSVSYDVMWDKTGYYSMSNKSDDEEFYFILDKKNKRLLDLDKNLKKEIVIKKFDDSIIEFKRTSSSLSNESFSIMRNTGIMEGIGEDKTEFGSTFYHYKGKCEPYKKVNI